MKAEQGGEIGLVLAVENYIPYSSNPKDVAAAERLTEFYTGWLVKSTKTTCHVHIFLFCCYQLL